jgi:hypothetical protein
MLCSDRIRLTLVISRRLNPSVGAAMSIINLLPVVHFEHTSMSKSGRLSVSTSNGMGFPIILSKSCLMANEASNVSASAIVSAARLERAILLDLKELNARMKHAPVSSARCITYPNCDERSELLCSEPSAYAKMRNVDLSNFEYRKERLGSVAPRKPS